MDEQTIQKVTDYINLNFAPEDQFLREIQQEAKRQQLPQISIQPFEGRLLQFLAMAIGAKKIVEIGTLAGYSGLWLARALPSDGKLYTIDASAKHVAIARAHFSRSGVADQVEVMQGQAMDMLHKLEPQAPFDFMFIDANKDQYPEYLAWAIENLREGGIVTAHNTVRDGRILAPEESDDEAVIAFNQTLATHPQLTSLLLAVGDGMAVAIKKG